MRSNLELCVTVVTMGGELGKHGRSGTSDPCANVDLVSIKPSTKDGRPLVFSRFGKCMDILLEAMGWGNSSWHGRIYCGGRGNNVPTRRTVQSSTGC